MAIKKKIKNQKVISEKTFLIITSLSCNSNCVMCSVGSKKQDLEAGDKKQIIKDLGRGRKGGYENMEFTGGEPTIRKDIFELVKRAKELGYKKIGISTNGILLGNKLFCDKLIKAGVTNITFSLHAYNKKLHETISRTPGSFEKTVTGIKNALTNKGLAVAVVTVVSKINYKYLLRIGKFIYSLGVPIWDITDLLPDKRAKENYKDLCVTREKLSIALNSIEPLLKKFQSIIFFAFSPCILSREMLNRKTIQFFTAQQKLDIEKPIRYNEKQSEENHDLKNINQKKVSICQKCVFSNQCSGIWTDYLNLFGEKEIAMLAIKNGCLR